MASGNQIPCGPCSFDDVTKDAGRWCANCEEGLCEECEKSHRKSKTSRNHKVISIEDYRKIENVPISQVCDHHGETLEWFCKSHDEVLCVVCVPSKHKACSEVTPIKDYTASSRQSTALTELEETIEETLCNVKHCVNNRDSAIKKIEKQEIAVKTMVIETRKKINGQLDKLQEKLLHELRSSSASCKLKYTKILQKLKSTEEMLTKLRQQTLSMKQFSSDIQVFLGTRQVNKRIASEIESIKSEISVTKDYTLKISIQSLIEKLSNEVEEFGRITVSESATNLDLTDQNIGKAQIEINVPTSRNISDIRLQLIRSFEMKSEHNVYVSYCVILPNGNLLMASHTSDKYLFEYSNTGEHIRDIRVSGPPYDIAVIDLDRIVVTYGSASYLEIMNYKTFIVEKTIKLENSCVAVSHENGRLYVVIGYDTIQVVDLSGMKQNMFKVASHSVTTIRDKIFYTDYRNHKIHCCHLNGEEVWQFKCDSIKFPDGITVDNYNHVYVVGHTSNNLTVIQHDGKDSKTLLTESDGLNCPKSVDFDSDKKTLLVCNPDGNVSLYKVV
ncbi:unnamed protein product [Mytilus edulis]|uniref:B box-type domain-containing protein n=1 Tax=Mytilus edulis TaxID=6550 RepID=A0A8S3TAY9_MYTED|nr:unnamed protein product [Mytilus edulis]